MILLLLGRAALFQTAKFLFVMKELDDWPV